MADPSRKRAGEPGPELISTREDFARELTAIRERSGLTVREVARRAGIPESTAEGYFTGRQLPPLEPVWPLLAFLNACGVTAPAATELWGLALRRVWQTWQTPSTAPVAPQAPPYLPPIPPYRGLARFESGDARWFHGRDGLIRLLTDRVTAKAGGGFVTVVGPSGAGKSSLIRAGLIPALGHEAESRGRTAPRTLLMTPGARPLAELAACLGVVRDTSGPRETVLVVDQFEEVFTACADAGERAGFVSALCDLRETVVVLGLRADFYPHVLKDPRMAAAFLDDQVTVGPMNEEELHQAITVPARQADVTLEPGLVELLLRDLAAVSGGSLRGAAPGSGALPLLSHALLSTWQRGGGKRMTVADYQACGGVSGAVATTAEAVYGRLDTPQRQIARQLFVRLVRVREDTGAGRRMLFPARPPADDDAVPAGSAHVIGEFAGQRLVTAGAETLEISHDALIHAWPRLRAWIDAELTERLTSRSLEDTAFAWRYQGGDPVALYGGARLSAAREWAREPGHEITGHARDFLDASVRRDRRRGRLTRQVVAGLSVLLLLTAAAGVVLSVRQAAQATRERDNAASRMLAGRAQRIGEKDVSLAAQLSLAAYRIAPTPEGLAALLASSAAPDTTRMLGSSPGTRAVALSPDGRLLAAGGDDHTVRFWSLGAAGHPAALGGPLTVGGDTVYTVAFSPNGRTLATGTGDAKVRLWDVTDPRRPLPLGAPLVGPSTWISSVAFGPDGRTLAAAGGESTVYLWDVADPAQGIGAPTRLEGAKRAVRSVAFGPEGRVLACGDDNGDVLLWNVTDPRAPTRLGTAVTGAGKIAYAVAFSRDGRALAVGDAEGRIKLRELTGATSHPAQDDPISVSASLVTALAFSPDGALLAIARDDGTLQIWDRLLRRVTQSFPHPGQVTSVVFHPDGQSVITGAADGVARRWSLSGSTLSGFTKTINFVAFGPEGRTLAVGSDDAHLWDRSRHRLVATLPNAGGYSGTAAFGGDGRTLAVSGGDGTLRLWTVADPAHPTPAAQAFKAHDSTVRGVAISGRSGLMATGSDDMEVRLWDVANPAKPVQLATLTGFTSSVYSVAFSPDGRTLAAGSLDKTIRLWDVSAPRSPVPLGAPLTGPRSSVVAVTFAPDGRTLAASSVDRSVYLWDVTDPRAATLLGSPLGMSRDYVYSLAFSPDGRALAAAGVDGSVWLWNTADRSRARLTAEIPTGFASLYSVAFAPDGKTLATGGAGGAVWIWDTDPERVAARICATSGDPITAQEWARYVPDLPYRAICPKAS
ncbi:helix-turn-helix domain-containing protein [Streptosporangium sp. NPDC051023]|uniref:nSTAND1 domain-containing NTPase n=1 Tax=Streptosporangium sp. NPDC051023 TaxID=3155410 RepID=UPI003450E57B